MDDLPLGMTLFNPKSSTVYIWRGVGCSIKRKHGVTRPQCMRTFFFDLFEFDIYLRGDRSARSKLQLLTVSLPFRLRTS